jgi:hypothetical protein
LRASPFRASGPIAAPAARRPEVRAVGARSVAQSFVSIPRRARAATVAKPAELSVRSAPAPHSFATIVSVGTVPTTHFPLWAIALRAALRSIIALVAAIARRVFIPIPLISRFGRFFSRVIVILSRGKKSEIVQRQFMR